MDHLPIFLDIRGKTVVIAGGGTLAARRVERALSAGGASVSAILRELSDEFRDLRGHERSDAVSRASRGGRS